MSLELIANKDYDRKTSEVCKEIAETGVLAEKNCKLQLDKAAELMDILEIGKRKFTELRVICKPEGFTIQRIINYPLIGASWHSLVTLKL